MISAHSAGLSALCCVGYYCYCCCGRAFCYCYLSYRNMWNT